ncbi:hypothetical protein CROQUDRAFT_151491 [Cronartium quercuum f. sp. fusiforme G11]|uniref:Retrovirus-related Pol polyprotein from transposon TNT 1-94-like beta-barrel domain-containing protein n=1 Tax=Cronartium quercuum f. sp. fusiforme G11 TaxID=708437 RepID=A0A9P6P007_9BASI|nr:hypothetical protein CROQUDRAFT_151491 [Cronartium quercuum f. sp. fusiforme G11]
MIRKYKEMTMNKANSAVINSSINKSTSSPSQTHEASDSSATPSFFDEAFATTVNVEEDIITLDTAATSHMFGNKDYISDLTPTVPSPINVASKNGKIYANHRGVAHLGGLRLTGVLWSKDLGVNLVSAGLLYDNGFKIQWSKDSANIYDQLGKFLLTFFRSLSSNKLWQVQV